MSTERPIESNEPDRRGARLRELWVLPVAAAVLVLMRLHAFGLPLEPDECNYAYIGQRLLAGDRLYVDVWDHQPPAVFALFAGTMAVAGSDTGTFRFMATAFSLTSLFLLYAIARRGADAYMAGAAALAFALASSDPGTAGEGCNREIYMNTFVLAGVAILAVLNGAHAPGSRRREVALIAAAGLCIGIGSTFKTVMAVQWMALLAWLLLRERRRPQGQRGALISAAVFAAGPALVWCSVFAYFGLTGRSTAFIEAVFRYNIDYAGAKTSALGRFAAFFVEGSRREIFVSAAPLWLAGGIALPVLTTLHWRSHRRARAPERSPQRSAPGTRHTGLAIAYSLGSLIAVCLPGHSWPHYYHLLIPPLALLTTRALDQLAHRHWGQRFSLYALPARGNGWRVLAAAWVGTIGIQQVRRYLSVPPTLLTETRYESRDWWGWAQGRNVAAVTDPGDAVLVVGADPGVYFYSGRRCATRYTMTTGLDEQIPGFQQRRRHVMEDLERRRPRLILIIDPTFPELEHFIRQNYVQAGPHFVDYHDRRPTEPIMQVVMDVHRPVEEIEWNWHRSALRQ